MQVNAKKVSRKPFCILVVSYHLVAVANVMEFQVMMETVLVHLLECHRLHATPLYFSPSFHVTRKYILSDEIYALGNRTAANYI